MNQWRKRFLITVATFFGALCAVQYYSGILLRLAIVYASFGLVSNVLFLSSSSTNVDIALYYSSDDTRVNSSYLNAVFALTRLLETAVGEDRERIISRLDHVRDENEVDYLRNIADDALRFYGRPNEPDGN